MQINCNHKEMCAYLVLITAYNIFAVYSAEYGELSRKMCRKYSEAVYVEQADLGMSSKIGFNKVSECGIVSTPLIIGGTKAAEKEFPHFALIGFGAYSEDDLAWLCGGSLISENYVLTAAHCSQSKEHGLAQKVRLGMITSGDDDETIKEEFIRRFIKHPNYKKPSKYNDIALIQLRMRIEFTPFIRPACLNTQNVLHERKAIAIGFGKTAEDDATGSSALMKVTLDLINRSSCNRYFPRRPTMKSGVTFSMICAGVLKGGKDTCQGDSGGPMQIILDDPYCMYNIIGITSFGVFCGYANSPAIYSNVSHFTSWIEKIVWKSSDE